MHCFDEKTFNQQQQQQILIFLITHSRSWSAAQSFAHRVLVSMKATKATSVASTDGDSFDSGFDEYREAVESQQATAQEAIAALEAQVAEDGREIKRLKASLKKREDQVKGLTAKLEARSHPPSVPALKEEIYQDLTGLVISSVQRDDNETILNCLQTGRNGTLHYKLAWPKNGHDQITFTPLLDADRDAVLMDILPDYLREQIMFTQDQANLFAFRLWTAIQKKI